MSRPHFVEVDGRRTRVRLDGAPDNPPVLLLHGIGRSMEDWAPQYELLARSHRVIAVDVPGFGFSDRPREAITLPGFARGVAAAVDAVGEARPLHIVGNSLGGAIAVQLLALQPERVASLVLVNSAGFGREVTPLLRMLAVPVIGALSTRRTTRMSARMFERTIYADRSVATKERIDHALAVGQQPHAGAVLRETAVELGTTRGVKPEWRRQLAGAVAPHRRPTLVMWGDRDRVLPAHHLAEARRVFPHAETHLFADIGHMPQIECPKEFADLVVPFLAGAVSEGRGSAPRR